MSFIDFADRKVSQKIAKKEPIKTTQFEAKKEVEKTTTAWQFEKIDFAKRGDQKVILSQRLKYLIGQNLEVKNFVDLAYFIALKNSQPWFNLPVPIHLHGLLRKTDILIYMDKEGIQIF